MANGPYWPQLRTIVLDRRSQEFVDREQQQSLRFEDHWRGVEWRLARTPEAGAPRVRSKPDGYLVCVIPANQLAKTRELWILYSYNQDEVQVHGIGFGPDGDADESQKVCPECGHVFQGNGWDGVDAHWRSKHEDIMPYEDAWPLLRDGKYMAQAPATSN